METMDGITFFETVVTSYTVSVVVDVFAIVELSAELSVEASVSDVSAVVLSVITPFLANNLSEPYLTPWNVAPARIPNTAPAHAIHASFLPNPLLFFFAAFFSVCFLFLTVGVWLPSLYPALSVDVKLLIC